MTSMRQAGRAAGLRLRRRRSSAEKQLCGPGGLEVSPPPSPRPSISDCKALTVHFALLLICVFVTLVKDGRTVAFYHPELMKRPVG